MNAIEIDRKHPIRNPVWHFSDDTNCWWTEASMLDHAGFNDPWSRPIPKIYQNSRTRFDREGEIVEYQYTTTVDGTQVELRVHND